MIREYDQNFIGLFEGLPYGNCTKHIEDYNRDDDASYSIDDKIGDYVNIFDTDDVHKGMSANVYVAFPITDNGKPLYMVYDVGYMGHDILATVYVDR